MYTLTIRSMGKKDMPIINRSEFQKKKDLVKALPRNKRIERIDSRTYVVLEN